MFRVAARELPETLRIAHPGTTVGVREARRGAPTATRRRSARRASTASRRRCGWPAAARPSSTTARWRSATPCPTTSRARASTSASGRRPSRLARALASAGRRRPRGRGGRRVLPRPLQRERPRRGEAGGHRPARGRRRLAHRRGARGRGRGAHQRGARAGLRGARPGLGARRRAGSVRTEAPSAGWDAVRDAIVTEYAREYDMVEDALDAETLELAESWPRSTGSGNDSVRGSVDAPYRHAPSPPVEERRPIASMPSFAPRHAAARCRRALRVPRDRVHERRPQLASAGRGPCRGS